MRCDRRICAGWFLKMLVVSSTAMLIGQQPEGARLDGASPTLTLKTTVRRVVVDVVVTDPQGNPIPDLQQEDFGLVEDGVPQKVLSFDAHGFTRQMDYMPPNMPAQPPNTFVNLPKTPEKGPLYVLLYDLLNVEYALDQMYARKELAKFIEDKPEGTRFAIFMLSDGLHLVQGFTSDKELLFGAIDPSRSRAHVPQLFTMGQNYGQNDAATSLWVLNYLASYLDGLPGRKNILWFTGGFPLALFPSDDESLTLRDEAKKTLALLARSQIAVYPVDLRGVSVENAHAPSGSTGGGGMTSDSRELSAGPSNTPAAGTMSAAGSISASAGGVGYSMLASSYMAEDEIAKTTGGRAFYSRNDLKTALTQATEDGENYYTLSYEPNDKSYDGKLHKIKVEMRQHGYLLAYRHAYYAVDPEMAQTPASRPRGAGWTEPPSPRPAGDSLDADMQYGAPMMHGLIFGAHVERVGGPAMGTPEQMARLANEPAFFKARRVNRAARPVAPVELQRYRIDYTVMAHQFQAASSEGAPQLEIAVAAYDDEGTRLNAAVNVASSGNAPGTQQQKSYRVEQEFLAPVTATALRMAVRDTHTDRIGAMEVKLPLQPDAQAAVPVEAPH